MINDEIIQKQDESNIIGGIAWIFIAITLIFFMFHYEVHNSILWFCTILFFIIMNIVTLYRSLDYVDRYDYTAIGVTGLIVTGVFLFIGIILIIIVLIAAIKGIQQQS